MKRYHLTTFGCQMNEHDSERMKGMLESLGYSEAPERSQADLILFNTCSIRESADSRFVAHLGEAKRLKREQPDRVVGVGGCWAQSVKEEVFERFPFVDVAFGPGQTHKLAEFLTSDSLSAQGYFELEGFTGHLPAKRARPFQGWVQISVGCNCRCSYCIVPSTRGREVSRPLEELVEEVRAMAADGVREVTLLGQNVNSYGRDLRALPYVERQHAGTPPVLLEAATRAYARAHVAARNQTATHAHLDPRAPIESGPDERANGSRRRSFAELLHALDAIEGIERIRYTSPHPKDMREDVIRAHAELRSVCEHIHLPLQSGSSRILKAMRRTYDRNRYLDRVALIREHVPDVALTTDIIVGFPGETEDDFEQTLEVAEQVGYDGAFTFIFSPRRHTEAARITDGVVPHPVKVERMKRLVEVVQRRAHVRAQRFVGRTMEVLVEGPSRTDPDRLRGRTRHNKVVNFSGLAAPGELAQVQITAASSQTLSGEELLLARAI
jgi:tRNA-2-methylthio-N6-dimethylallyladenosine synthase